MACAEVQPAARGRRRQAPVVVDDSIVRGNTTRQIVRMLRDAVRRDPSADHGAADQEPLPYGIDMSTREEMIAHGRTVAQIAAAACRSLAYLSLEGVYEAVAGSRERHCDACFTGAYPLAAARTRSARTRSSCPSWPPDGGAPGRAGAACP